MTAERIDIFLQAAEELEIEMDVRPEYSGRGMYGATTAAIVVGSLSDAFSLIFRAGEIAREDEMTFEPFRPTMDQMGRGIILY